jgi:hypothetical protein
MLKKNGVLNVNSLGMLLIPHTIHNASTAYRKFVPGYGTFREELGRN